MSTTADLRERRTDRMIAATVRALLGEETLEQVAASVGIAKSTLYRRMDVGGFKAYEVAILAAHFNRPVSALYDGDVGRIDPPPETAAAPTRRRSYSSSASRRIETELIQNQSPVAA